jgi:transcriptional regulator with XRE-family HTH domain
MTNRHAKERRLRALLVQRAIETDAPLLAARLHRYAQREGISWAELAHRLGTEEEGLNRIACCYPPRTELFVADVEAIAQVGGVETDRLLPILRRLQVTEALAERAAETRGAYVTDQSLLAAREREEPQREDE